MLKSPYIAAVLACSVLIAEPTLAQQVERDSVQRRAVTYPSGNVTITATLLQRSGVRPVAAVVIVHGSGSSSRDNPWTKAYAEALAHRGIVVLYPDKRGSGESSGDWRESSIQDLAADTKAGLAFLRRQPNVDTTGIGIIGFSQGGYVASVVAAEDSTVGFAAVISGGTASMRDQIVDELVLEAGRTDRPLTAPEVLRLRDLYGRLFSAARNPQVWEDYAHAISAAKAEGGALAHALRTIPLDSGHWAVRYLATIGDFDPMPYWDQVAVPVLFVYGGADTQIRVDASVERLRASPAKRHFTTLLLGANGHALFRDDVVALLVEWFRMRGTDK